MKKQMTPWLPIGAALVFQLVELVIVIGNQHPAAANLAGNSLVHKFAAAVISQFSVSQAIISFLQ